MEYTKTELKRTGVYTIKNLTNGKQYIGSTSENFQVRWQSHKRHLRNNTHHSKHLEAAFNKYKEDLFEFNIVEYCEPELCIEREQYYLDYFKTYSNSNGYNILPTAGSRLGAKHSSDSIEKMKNKTFTEETRLKMRNSQLGKKVTEQTKQKLREANIGKKASDEAKLNMSIAAKGRVVSEETRRKLSLSNMKQYLIIDPDNKEFIVNNLSLFCTENDLNCRAMRYVAIGRQYTHKNWKCYKYNI